MGNVHFLWNQNFCRKPKNEPKEPRQKTPLARFSCPSRQLNGAGGEAITFGEKEGKKKEEGMKQNEYFFKQQKIAINNVNFYY